MVADFFGASPLPQDRVGFSPSRVGQHSLVLARRVQAGRPHAYPPNCDFGSVRRRARRSAAPDRRGAIEPPAIQSPAILSALLAVATGVAVLRGGRRARYRRNNRHRADPADHGGAALRLLRAALLRAAELLRGTLSPHVSRCWHSGGPPGVVSGSFIPPRQLPLLQGRERLPPLSGHHLAVRTRGPARAGRSGHLECRPGCRARARDYAQRRLVGLGSSLLAFTSRPLTVQRLQSPEMAARGE